jgi:osmotically-inducible protein OsmY
LIWIKMPFARMRQFDVLTTEDVMSAKTDRQLQTDVIAELAWDPAIEASRIGVEVVDGVVTLSGHVLSFAEKWNAEQAAQRVAGVKGVVLELKVTLPGGAEHADAELAKRAVSALEWSISVPRNAVKVRVEDGWVTLTGDVDWAYARDAAAACVRSLMGIKGVVNNIAVHPKVALENVKTKIEAALQRRAHADVKGITVTVKDGTVTLAGHVNSLTERLTMENAAWSAPGVRNVVDNLTVR